MPLKRQHSVPSPDTTSARKVPRLTSVHISSSSQAQQRSPTLVSPTETEHIPSPPSGLLVCAPQPVSHSDSLLGLSPSQLASRLDALTERYERGVDEVEMDVINLRRQISVARRTLEATPSFDGGDSTHSATQAVGVLVGRSRSWTASEELVADSGEAGDGIRVSEDGGQDATLRFPRATGAATARDGNDAERDGAESESRGVDSGRVEGETGVEPAASPEDGSGGGDDGSR